LHRFIKIKNNFLIKQNLLIKNHFKFMKKINIINWTILLQKLYSNWQYLKKI
jgi:hypothetical protein